MPTGVEQPVGRPLSRGNIAFTSRRGGPPSGVRRLGAHAAVVMAHVGHHFKIALEYRASFFGQILAMFINDGMWLVFWVLYFTRFPVIRGWERGDVIMLWAILAFGYGLVTGVFGNATGLAPVIMQGQLDVYLTQPKSVLVQALIARMSPASWGDLLFGVTVFTIFGQPDWGRLALFLACGVLTAAIFGAFAVLANSTAFFLGGAETAASNLTNAMLHFSTFPNVMFEGATRVVLFTLIPAGFLHTMPVKVMRDFDPLFFAGVVGVAVFLTLSAWAVFRAGLRRYESGNLVHLRE